MKTVLTKSPDEAAEFIKRGGAVAFPTETVYGLGANVFDEKAVAKIFEAKRRPADNPLIAHVADVEHIGLLTTEITENAEKFIAAFFPGPLTVVLKKSTKVPTIASAGLDTIGIRMPRFELAHQFLTICGRPVVAPSANLSGKPSPTTWQAVAEDLDGRIDCILQGSGCEIGLESTVVDCSGSESVLLRNGAISLAELRAVVPETIDGKQLDAEAPRSPGLKHRHYSPNAKVVIVNGDEVTQSSNAAYIGLNQPAVRFEFKLVCTNANEYAHSLFEFFRDCDRQGFNTIYCEAVDERGIGAALMDRIRRAAVG